MKVLIVEDDFTARKIILGYLSKIAYCEIAVNGEEAVQAFRGALESDQPYDLVCLDISMPGKSGQEVLFEIREMEQNSGIQLGKGSKVIMTTCYTDGTNLITAFRIGCEDYLVKPIEYDTLISKIEKLGLLPAKI